MTTVLRIELIGLAFLAIVIVVHAVNKRVLQLNYSLMWLAIAFGLVIVACFPEIAFAIAAFVGIETPSNLIFLLAILALLGICFSLSIIVSRQSAKIKRLIQLLSIDRNESGECQEEPNESKGEDD